MTDKDIDYLVTCLQAGLYVFWLDSTGVLRQLESISQHPEEPSRVGWLVGCGYITLYNVTREDFIITSLQIAQWPT
jgi:hypothetical protein